MTYTYDVNHKHAVASLSNGNSYVYDANGNMTQRNADSKSYTFAYDAENRLTAVSGDSTATFTYNGDGQRVKSVMDGETTLFVGGHYEVTNPGAGQTITKYYMAGATRVAIRKDGVLSYMLADHLGSTSLVTDVNGNRTSELRYKPWGETRYSFGTMPTKYTFTGQFSYTDDPSTQNITEGFGLMYYNARWMDPQLGRFTQADTIVPPGVQGQDRYAYSNNNPVRYADPSGHVAEECEELDDCDEMERMTPMEQVQEELLAFHWNFIGKWTLAELKIILQAAYAIQTYVNRLAPGKGLAWMNKYMGSIDFIHGGLPGDKSWVSGSTVHMDMDWLCGGCSDSGNAETIVHELGHIFDNRTNGNGPCIGVCGGGASDAMHAALADSPATGIRWANGINGMPSNYQWTNPYDDYGNNSTADYFAEVFQHAVFAQSSPADANGWGGEVILQAIIITEASMLP